MTIFHRVSFASRFWIIGFAHLVVIAEDDSVLQHGLTLYYGLLACSSYGVAMDDGRQKCKTWLALATSLCDYVEAGRVRIFRLGWRWR